MPNYSIPPWLSQPANPAAHYMSGVQVGVRIGAQQASQQFAQQQYLREMQKDEFERQYKAQARQIEIDDITRRHKAIANYQDMINQGVDPMTALRQTGPDMGITPDRIEQIDAMRQYRLEQQKATEAYRTGELELGRESLELRKQAAEQSQQRMDLAAEKEKRIAANAQQRMKQSLVGIISRDSTLKQLQTELDSAKKLVSDLDSELPRSLKHPFNRPASEITTEKENTKKGIKELQKQIDDRKNELQGQFSEMSAASGYSEEPQPGDSAGNDTMPDQPAASNKFKTISGFKVWLE